MINLLFMFLVPSLAATHTFSVDDSQSSSFGDFALGKGYDISRFQPMETHVFREASNDLKYDLMPLTKTHTTCSLVSSVSDITDNLSIHGEVSVKYKMISGSGFLEYDRDQETMRKVLYFQCTVDRTLFTVSVNAPEITPDMTAEEKKQFLPAHLVAMDQPVDLQAEVGDYHIRSITYGRRYQTEVSISYTNDRSYDKIAGGLEAKVEMGVLEVSAKINLEMKSENKESEMRLGVASQAYGFIEPQALYFATEEDAEGNDPAQQIEAQLAENLKAFNAIDNGNGSNPIPSARTSMTKGDLFGIIGDAYPLSYTIAENRPFYDVLERLSPIEQRNMIRNLDEAYDILRELENLYVDTDTRAETLFENYHLLSGATPLSTTFLEYRHSLLTTIMDLQKEVNEYLSQTPINIAGKSVYDWARRHEVPKQLDTLSLDLLRTDLFSLMGMEDETMDDENPVGTTCLFNGIQATVDGTRLKFAGRVVFGEEVVRHVLFDIDGRVVSLGFVDHSDDAAYITQNDPHELVFVREDCTLLRQGSTVWYKAARYTISGIGSAEHKTSDGYVNKEKLTNIRINLTPEDSTQRITVVLTDREIADVTLRGAESSYGFTVDDEDRLMYSNGYVCDNGFGFNEAKMVCSDLGYSRLETFETDYDIPAKNAWGRPHVTMFDLDCPEFSMSVTECSSSTAIDDINWEVCSSKNGVKLICSNEEMSDTDMQVEIQSASGQGCILDESTGMNERIDTFKRCLGGENDDHEFVGVDRTVIIGEMCLKLFHDDVLQCVLPEGEHDLSDPLQSAAFCYSDFSSNSFPDEVELMNQGDYTITMVATEDSYLPSPTGEMIPVVAEFESDDGEVQTFTFDVMQEHEFSGDFRCGSQFQLRVSPSQIYDHGDVMCAIVPIEGRFDDNGRGVVNGHIRASFECTYPPSVSPTFPPPSVSPTFAPFSANAWESEAGIYCRNGQVSTGWGSEDKTHSQCRDMCLENADCMSYLWRTRKTCHLRTYTDSSLCDDSEAGYTMYFRPIEPTCYRSLGNSYCRGINGQEAEMEKLVLHDMNADECRMECTKDSHCHGYHTQSDGRCHIYSEPPTSIKSTQLVGECFQKYECGEGTSMMCDDSVNEDLLNAYNHATQQSFHCAYIASTDDIGMEELCACLNTMDTSRFTQPQYDCFSKSEDHWTISGLFQTCIMSSYDGYELIFRQTLPYLYHEGELRLNADNPESENFSILDELESFRSSDGKFHFFMRWPGDVTEFEWTQTSNPVTEGIQGYEPVNVPYSGRHWGGLEPSRYALLSGSVNNDNWFYAIGSFSLWNNGIPSYAKTDSDSNYPQQSVELYARRF